MAASVIVGLMNLTTSLYRLKKEHQDTCKFAKKTYQLQCRISLSLFVNEEYSIAHGTACTFLHASLETLLWFACQLTLESPKIQL